VRQPNGTVVKLPGLKASTGYPSTAADLFCEGQAGMNGVAVDPSFVSDRFICVYSTSSLTAPGTNRVRRVKVNEAVTAVSDRIDIVTDIQYTSHASNHPVGGPDAHRWQGAIHRSRRQGRTRQWRAGGLRPSRLHLRPSQPARHCLPVRHQPAVHDPWRNAGSDFQRYPPARLRCFIGTCRWP
jgi:hypothetical protein